MSKEEIAFSDSIPDGKLLCKLTVALANFYHIILLMDRILPKIYFYLHW